MLAVQFINCEDEGIDQIVSFAIAWGEMDVRSLILLRTPIYEAMLDPDERGVSVSMENDAGDEDDMLKAVRIEAERVTIVARTSKYVLDVRRVDRAEMSEMKALLGRMNFDSKFRFEDV